MSLWACPVWVYMVEWQRRGLAALGLLQPAQEGGVDSELLQGGAPLQAWKSFRPREAGRLSGRKWNKVSQIGIGVLILLVYTPLKSSCRD